jgi:hypothetical protein
MQFVFTNNKVSKVVFFVFENVGSLVYTLIQCFGAFPPECIHVKEEAAESLIILNEESN